MCNNLSNLIGCSLHSRCTFIGKIPPKCIPFSLGKYSKLSSKKWHFDFKAYPWLAGQYLLPY